MMKMNCYRKILALASAALLTLHLTGCTDRTISAENPAAGILEEKEQTSTQMAEIKEIQKESTTVYDYKQKNEADCSTDAEIQQEKTGVFAETAAEEIPETAPQGDLPSQSASETPSQPLPEKEQAPSAKEPESEAEAVVLQPQQQPADSNFEESDERPTFEGMNFVYADEYQKDTHPGLQDTKPDTGDAILDNWLSFALEYDQLTMEVGKSHQMVYTYYGTDPKFTWRSETPEIISVDQTGQITALTEGKGKIVVFSADCGARTCVITVVQKILTKDEQARQVAQQIAYVIMNDPTITTDIERVAYATRFVHEYVKMGHTSSFHEDCRTAYGVFVAGYSNCVGATKATGLVLEYMGYSWSHVNIGQWGHQWCEVYGVDGQTAWCDGSSYGVVGFGTRQEDGSNWLYMTNQGQLVNYFEH